MTKKEILQLARWYYQIKDHPANIYFDNRYTITLNDIINDITNYNISKNIE